MTNARGRIAIIGGGPIGIEAALEALRRGFDVAVYEAGRVGSHLRRFGHVTLFTPFRMNSTDRGRNLLRESGVALPEGESLLTAAELADRYLVPLASLPALRGAVRERSRVTHVGREGAAKPEAIVAAGDPRRSGLPFLLRVESAGGKVAFERADTVLDATGVYASANATGPGGLPAIGEDSLADRIERHIPDLSGPSGVSYPGRRILLVGSGHSAATALVDMESRARKGAGPERVDWVVRGEAFEAPYREAPDDPLPARRDLNRRANEIAAGASWLVRHPGAIVERYEVGTSGVVRVTMSDPTGSERVIDIDHVLALVGYRPDMEITREIHVHHCYASEAPMKLATAILAAGPGGGDSERAADCLSQTAHGAESLRNPEPDFYIVGSKSYGRGSNFLLTLGHEQVHDALALIEAETADRTAVPSPAR